MFVCGTPPAGSPTRGGFHQAVNHRTGFGDLDGVYDMPVGTAHRKGTDRPLRGRVVNGDPAVLQEHLQVFLLVQAVFQTVPRLLTQDRGRLLLPNPCKISLHERLYLLLAAIISLLCGFILVCLVGLVDRCDLHQCLVGNGLSCILLVLVLQCFQRIGVVPAGMCLIRELK